MNDLATSGRHTGRHRADHVLALQLAAGRSVRQAARTVGVSEATVHRRLKDGQFLALLDRFRELATERVLDRMAGHAAASATPEQE